MALEMVAALIEQKVVLGQRLHALGDDVEVEALRHCDDGGGDGRAVPRDEQR